MRDWLISQVTAGTIALLLSASAIATELPSPTVQNRLPNPPTTHHPPLTTNHQPLPDLDLDPKLIDRSPVLQRWLKQIPNVERDIRESPSFRTRWRVGYAQFPSTDDAKGIQLGVDDLFLAQSRFTVSADYRAAWNGDRTAWGADLRYYALPLGSYVNVAPVVGYRQVETNRYERSGANLGLRLLLVPSRGGGADIAVTHTWVAPGSSGEVGITSITFGYAVTQNVRLFSEIQWQKAKERKDSQVGIGLEWMP